MLLSLAGLDIPSSSRQLFGRKGPLVVEAGFGDGWFLSRMAREHPAWNIVGADISIGSVTRAFRRLQRERISNVRLYRGPVQFIIRNLVLPGGLHRMYVNYPDPWPKKKHRNKRLLRADFFRLLSTRLQPRGTLYLTTDHAEYFCSAMEAAQGTGLFHVMEKIPPTTMLHTKYARKWRAQNLTIHHARIEKITESGDVLPPTVTPSPHMHHALLKGPLPTLDAFEPFTHTFSGGRVLFLDTLRPAGFVGFVFTARVLEELLTQDLMIEVRTDHKDSDTVFVGVSPFGQPLATRGTGEAILAITRYLAKLGLQLVERYF